MLQRLELSAGETGAERQGRIRRALREAGRSPALVISGSFEGDVADARAHADTVNLLIDATVPVVTLISGPIGPQGFGLMLAADHAILGPDARVVGNWRRASGAMALARNRCGPLLAHRMAFAPSVDPLMLLSDSGFATRAADPALVLEEMIARFAENGLGRRLKRSLRAASELPLKEALSFDFWFTHAQDDSAR
ncbi:hypothetical protein [Microvirga lenta]|uniref:hypothetical protein n=1 Tax=Microvirga lenta TaxID=2881337 RepID=UPI001CFE70D7|nr:hypothetical protein [Microvirga lenta]MCB5174627.1 hypothetical protein [Microvirga lenta]